MPIPKNIFAKRILVMGILLFLGQACNQPKKAPKDYDQPKQTSGNFTDEKIYTSVEYMPEFAGGPDAWRRMMEKALEVSEKDIEKGFTGNIIYSAVLEKNGSLSNIDINGRKPKDFFTVDSAVYKILFDSKWTVGKINGENVRVRITNTIRIHLE